MQSKVGGIRALDIKNEEVKFCFIPEPDLTLLAARVPSPEGEGKSIDSIIKERRNLRAFGGAVVRLVRVIAMSPEK